MCQITILMFSCKFIKTSKVIKLKKTFVTCMMITFKSYLKVLLYNNTIVYKM